MPDNSPRPPADMKALLAIMAKLRAPDGGCPWDVAQTFRSIAPYTIEEAYEVADAIARDDLPAVKDELGDLLFQVVFHARMAEEAGQFAFEDVVTAICDKMVRRHPRVFGDGHVTDADAQTAAWEAMKAVERSATARESGGRASVLDNIPANLPAMKQAEKMQKRAARVGFDWNEARDVLGKVREELEEVEVELESGTLRENLAEEVGDLLFACVNLARKAGVEPGMALRRANLKFDRRFRRIEDLLAAEGRTPEQATLEEMETLWTRAKTEERKP